MNKKPIIRGDFVIVHSIMAKSMILHLYLMPYVGHAGFVMGRAKNGMLLVRFRKKKNKRRENYNQYRSIPHSCVQKLENVKIKICGSII